MIKTKLYYINTLDPYILLPTLDSGISIKYIVIRWTVHSIPIYFILGLNVAMQQVTERGSYTYYAIKSNELQFKL